MHHNQLQSKLEKTAVSCCKVFVSDVLCPTRSQPKFVLWGIDRVGFWGEHKTILGWYESEEDVQKEIADITEAMQNGQSNYTIKYAVEVENGLRWKLKKTEKSGTTSTIKVLLIILTVLFVLLLAYTLGEDIGRFLYYVLH